MQDFFVNDLTVCVIVGFTTISGPRVGDEQFFAQPLYGSARKVWEDKTYAGGIQRIHERTPK